MIDNIANKRLHNNLDLYRKGTRVIHHDIMKHGKYNDNDCLI